MDSVIAQGLASKTLVVEDVSMDRELPVHDMEVGAMLGGWWVELYDLSEEGQECDVVCITEITGTWGKVIEAF